MSSESLFLCHRLPFPPDKGDKIRSFALLKHLAKQGPVSVGCFIDDPLDMRYIDDVRALAGGDCRFVALGPVAKWTGAALALANGQPITTSYFGSKALMRWVSDISANKPIDNWVVFGSAMAPYLMRQACNGSRVLFDMVDVDSDKWRQYAAASSGILKWIYTREANSLEALERKAAAHFGKTLLVSPFEARAFQSLAQESRDKITSLANGVDLEYFRPGEFVNPFRDHERAIVMTGRMDYRPNYEGAIWFSEKVAPSIFAQLPAAKVYFVGSNPPSSLRRMAGPRISVTGRVDDVRPYLQHAAAVVAPLQMARGVQNKVLEAMAMAKPIVATREATRALDVNNGTHLWIENEPERFAAAVVKAVEGPDRAIVMRNARTFVECNHSWERILSDFDKHLEQLKSKITARSPAGASPRMTRMTITDWDRNSNRAEA
jgi:sugar transferase (PEP-CTERM/EpsH1 system associated)